MVMANQHNIQDKLRAEIQDLLSRSPEPSYAEIERLPYLENFLKEIMRVYPPGKTDHIQPLSERHLWARN